VLLFAPILPNITGDSLHGPSPPTMRHLRYGALLAILKRDGTAIDEASCLCVSLPFCSTVGYAQTTIYNGCVTRKIPNYTGHVHRIDSCDTLLCRCRISSSAIKFINSLYVNHAVHALSPVHTGDKVDCCRNRRQIGDIVDCRRTPIRSTFNKVDRVEFNFVASVYRAWSPTQP